MTCLRRQPETRRGADSGNGVRPDWLGIGRPATRRVKDSGSRLNRRLPRPDAITARCLGLVEGVVGTPDEVIHGVGGIVRRDAEADGNA